MAMQLLFVPLFVALLWAVLVGVRWGFGGFEEAGLEEQEEAMVRRWVRE